MFFSLLFLNRDVIHTSHKIHHLKHIHQVVRPSPLSSPRTFLSPLKEAAYPLAVILRSLFPPAPATTGLPSVFMDLPVLDISHRWKHTTCGLLYVASFTQHSDCRVHPCRSICPFTVDGPWLFPPSGYCE